MVSLVSFILWCLIPFSSILSVELGKQTFNLPYSEFLVECACQSRHRPWRKTSILRMFMDSFLNYLWITRCARLWGAQRTQGDRVNMGSLLSFGNGGGTSRHLKGCPHMPPSRSLTLQDAEDPKSLGCFVPSVQPVLFSLDSLNVAFTLSLIVCIIDLSSHG